MWLRIALVTSVWTLLFHLVVLGATGQNPVATPISEMSRQQWGGLHTFLLILFGGAHLALVIALSGMDRGWLWQIARGLLAASGLGLVYLAYYFYSASDATLNGSYAEAPLWVVASLTGLAMGALQPGLARVSHRVGVFSGICLGLWLWMMPLFFVVSDAWVGGYQRLVGAIYITWVIGVLLGLIRRSRVSAEV